MQKRICLMLLLAVFVTPFYSQNKVSEIKPGRSVFDAGKPNIINPESNTPFPYDHSVDKGILDKSGNLWFATTEGIYRYDGKLFTRYRVMDGLHVDHVSCMLADRAGHIWFGADGGIVRCDPSVSTATFTSIKIRRADGKGDGAAMQGQDASDAGNMVTHMIEDRQGAIWFSIGYEVYLSDGKAGEAISTIVGDFLKSEKLPYHCAYPHDFGICGMYADPQGNILISTMACSCGPNITYRLDGGRLHHPCILNQCKHHLTDPQDSLAHFREIASSFSKIKNEDGRTDIAFTTVREDRTGRIWVGSDSGVYLYSGGQFIHFTKGDVLSKSVVNTIYEDQQGNIWFGTGESAHFHGNGVFRYDPSAALVTGAPAITQFTAADGLCSNGPFKNDIVSSVAEDNTGKLWVSGNGGAGYYNGKGFTGLTKKDGFTTQPVNDMLKDKAGNMWFGAWELGLYRYDGKSLICFTR